MMMNIAGQHSVPDKTSATTPDLTVDRQIISSTYDLIRPHIRETPVVETEGADFGVDGIRLIHKPELLQHSGSFKVRALLPTC